LGLRLRKQEPVETTVFRAKDDPGVSRGSCNEPENFQRELGGAQFGLYVVSVQK
jgi:hypothetical protein